MTRFVKASVGLLAGASMLAACGGSDSAGGESAASSSTPATSAGTNLLAVGETKYGQVCASCHMADGKGSPGVFPPLAGSEWVTTSEVNVPIGIVLHGLQGAITVKGTGYDGMMQPWGMIPDSDIAAILTYVRSAWGNNASPITVEQVAAVREAEGPRSAWTAEELKAKYPGL
jgi:mono/diheme cytochrome c family protein